MTGAPIEATPEALAAALRLPVWNTLADRAETLRLSLPPRPETAPERCAWLHSLTAAQQRDAALLEHLEALCEHLAGRPAPGYRADDRLPTAALEAVEGFTSDSTAELITAYRELAASLP